MALNGSFYTNVSGGYRLQLEWYATQDYGSNTSTVYTNLYWMSLGSSWYTSTSAYKAVSCTIDGVKQVGGEAGLAALSGNQKKWVYGYSRTISHNGDGTKSLELAGTFDIALTLSGVYYASVDTRQTVTLDTIPRASSISSYLDTTAGDNININISRASSSFTHDCEFWLRDSANAWQKVKTITGLGDSGTFSMSQADVVKEFQILNTRSDCELCLTLITKSGGTEVGRKDHYGRCYTRNTGYVSFAGFTIGNNVQVTIGNYDPMYNYKIIFKYGSFSKTVAVNSATYNVTFSAAEATSMHAQIPNSASGPGTAECWTYYSTTQVRTNINSGYTAWAQTTGPTLGTGYTYADTATAITAITGNNQYIVQNKSTVRVTIPVAARALPVNSATVSNYSITLNGVEKTAAWSGTADVAVDFGTVSAGSNLNLSVKAIDSRGNSTTTSKTVTVVPYSPPAVNTTVERKNNFEATTTIAVSGSFSLLPVASVNKNTVSAVEYRYKEKTTSTWGGWVKPTHTLSGANYSITTVTLTLDNLKAYDFEIRVTDKLGNVVVSKAVAVGQPIFFIDAVKKSIGINQFPSGTLTTEVTGDIVLTPNPASVKLGEIFTADTTKNYIKFTQAYGSNDPGFIMHETGIAADANKGVLHLCPSDDNDNVNDYIAIHGTNDPESIKLYTGGNIVSTGAVTATRFESGRDLYLANAGLKLNNSDIWGVNALVFNDVCESDGEGLMFLQSGKVVGSTNYRDYSFFYIRDSGMYWDGASIFWKFADTSNIRLAGEMYSQSTGGMIFNVWGNLQAQTTAQSTEVFRITDSKGRDKYNTAVGWNGGNSNYFVYGGHHRFETDGKYTVEIFTRGDNSNVIHFGGATIEWDPNAIQFECRSWDDKGWANMAAGYFANSSSREYKTNIRALEDGALDTINNATVSRYYMKEDLQSGEKIGLIAEDAPSSVQEMGGKGVNSYSMVSIAWKAIQELSEQVKYLNNKINKM